MIDKYIFLSYSTKDSEIATDIKFFFEKEGYKVWMAPLGIPVGSTYPAVIESVIRDAEVLLLVASENICRSNWINKEVERAINYSKKVFALRVDDSVLNDEFNFLLACTQCSERIYKISLEDSAFSRAYENFRKLFLDDNAEPHIKLKTYDKTAIEKTMDKETALKEADHIVQAFLNGPESAIDVLSVLHFKTINKFVFAKYDSLEQEQKDRIFNTLLEAYSLVFENKNISGRKEQAAKGQLIYYLTRFNKLCSTLIPKLKEYYYLEDNIWQRQSIAYGLASLGDYEIPFDFAKRIYYQEDEDLINRSWTLCFYQDVVCDDAYLYLDDGTADWTNAKNARIKRLRQNDDKTVMAYRPLDVAVLLAFCRSRNCKLKQSDIDVIRHMKLSKDMGKDVRHFVKKVIKELLKIK